jgi:predicted TIM-barrel fold metal-dependent hydrolase
VSPPLNFFDANCMIGRTVRPLPTHMVQEPDDIIAELAAHHVPEALTVHAHAVERSIQDGNREITAIARLYPGIMHPVWVVPQHSALDIPDPEEFLAEMFENDVLVVRVPTAAYHGHIVDEWALGPLWRVLESRHVLVLIEGSDLARYPDQPARGFSGANIYQICRTFPQLPVILLRINFSCLRLIVPLLRECPNLLVEVSYFTAHRGLELIVEQVGAERVVFGSGLPWTPPGPALASILYADISAGEQALIAGDNLRRLLSDVRR